MNTLKAEKRTMDTKAKRLRREGYVTGNVFGREMEGSLPVKIEKSAVEKLLKTNNKGSQIMLDVDGQSYDVLIKEIQFNPLKGQVDEIDFQALVSNEKVHSVAEIVLVNHDKLEAGVLQQHLEEISFRALPSALVDKVMVDVGDMKVGDVIKVKDLAIAQDKDVDLKTDLEAAVVSVAAVHVDPALEAEGKNPFQLDSKEPNWEDFQGFLKGEVRYASVMKQYPAEAEELFKAAEENAKWRYNSYKRLARENWGADTAE